MFIHIWGFWIDKSVERKFIVHLLPYRRKNHFSPKILVRWNVCLISFKKHARNRANPENRVQFDFYSGTYTSVFALCFHVELRTVLGEFVLGSHESDEMWLSGFGSRVPEVYHIARCASDTFKVSKTFENSRHAWGYLHPHWAGACQRFSWIQMLTEVVTWLTQQDFPVFPPRRWCIFDTVFFVGNFSIWHCERRCDNICHVFSGCIFVFGTRPIEHLSTVLVLRVDMPKSENWKGQLPWLEVMEWCDCVCGSWVVVRKDQSFLRAWHIIYCSQQVVGL